MSELKDKIKQSMNNAYENGYDYYNRMYSSLEVATDLVMFDSELEDCDIYVVRKYVDEIRGQQ